MFLVVITFFFCINVKAECLSELKITGYTLVPSFNTNTYKYNVFINGKTINIKGKSKNNNSIINGLGNFEVTNETNTFVVKCDKEEYILKVFNDNISKDRSAYLSSLEILGVELDFEKDKFYYEIDRPDEIILNYNSLNPNAKIKVEELEDEITISVSNEEVTNTYVIKMNKLVKVDSNNQKRIIRKEMKTYEKVITISMLCTVVLLIMNVVRKKLF